MTAAVIVLSYFGGISEEVCGIKEGGRGVGEGRGWRWGWVGEGGRRGEGGGSRVFFSMDSLNKIKIFCVCLPFIPLFLSPWYIMTNNLGMIR